MNTQTIAMPSVLFPLNGAVSPRHFAEDFRFNFNLFSTMRQALRSRVQEMSITIMGRADFIHHITLHMPEVSARIEEDDFGILHLEMGAMKLATGDAVERYELHTVRRHFSFVSYLFEHADKALYDAILVSYLEGLFLGEVTPAHERARSLLPANLADALKKAELRYQLLEWQAAKY